MRTVVLMDSIYVILRSGISGGTGTLSIRIGTWLVSKGYEVVYICQEINDANNARTMESKGIKVHCWSLKETINNIYRVYGKNRRYSFLTFSLLEFAFVEKFRKRLIVSRSILYIVHSSGLLIGSGIEFQLAKRLLRDAYGRIIQVLSSNNNIIFMDEKSIETTENYYKIKIQNSKQKLLRLPMCVNEFRPEKINKKHNLGCFRILTICRAEFPFKGYVMGLVKDFERLCLKHENLRLTIVSFGEKEKELREYIQSLEDKIKEKIELIGQTPYEELGEFFEKSHLYIGMGTTLLDAANNGLPAITVKSYTYESFSSGFLHQNPHMLSADPDENTPTITYIEQVVKMNKQRYFELCKKSYAALQSMYGIETFMDRFLAIEPIKKETVLSRWELFICNLRKPKFLSRK